MLPTAGLFLPETLHRSDRPMSSHTDPDSTRLKYFQRKSGQPKHEAKEAGSSPPATTILASIEDLDDFPSISTASRFADFVFTSSKAASDAHTLALLIRRVQQDVSEASRLYLSPAVTNFLEAWPDKKTWIDAILIDVRRSLNDVGSYMESFRVVGDDGGPTGVKRRFEWIAAHQKKLIGRQQLLSTCHQSLVMTINIMQTVELCGVTTGTWQDPIYEAPVHPWTKSDPESVLRGPYSRREYRMSQKNFSISSMHLPHTEQDSLETRSVHSILAELPGSTPDGLSYSTDANGLTPTRLQSNARRASNRRTYLTRTFSDRMLQKTHNTSPNMRPPIPELDQSHLSPMPEPAAIRKSFDQSILTTSYTSDNRTKVFDDCQRLSLDNPRPTFNPQNISSERAPTNDSPSKQGFVQALPILAENTIERSDSTMSTTAIMTVPQVAKRYHANPIYIRKHPDRYRSLPTELPHVQSQSSLTEDLADWMMLPRIQSEKIPSHEWDADAVVASSSMSVMSCPAVTGANINVESASAGEREITAEHSTATTSTPVTINEPVDQQLSKPPTIQIGRTSAYLEPEHHIAGNRERAASVRSTSSIIMRKPLPFSAKINSEIMIATSDTTGETDMPSINTSLDCSPPWVTTNATPDIELSAIQEKMVSQQYVTAPEAELAQIASPTKTLSYESTRSDKDEAQRHLKPEDMMKPESVTDNTAQSQQNVTPENIVNQAYLTTNEAASQHNAQFDANTVTRAPLPAEAVIEEKISIPEQVSVPLTPPIPSLPPITAKPMSAQAKRRAAHQHRMELAFGNN